MEVDDRALGKAGGARMAAPTSTRCLYYRSEATYSHPRSDQTPGSPQSIHTDMDVAMEIRGLGMGLSSEARKVIPRMEAPPKQTGMLSAPNLVTSITKGMTVVVREILERFTRPPPVDDAVDAAIREHFQQRRAVALQLTLAGTESSGRVSAFDQLGPRRGRRSVGA